MRKKDPEKVDMGRRFREAREKKNWTREQLAERAELSVPFLADLELGNTGVRLDRFQKLCKILDADANYILFGKTQMPEETITALLRDRDEKTLRIVENTVRAMPDAMDGN